ncbi:MAG: Crp/Fnr family transcriptional regulator [Gammaproteobacteria bacterium]
MSREEIANYLGLAPETISRLLSHLQTQNIVNIQRRHVVLKDMQQLQDICV